MSRQGPFGRTAKAMVDSEISDTGANSVNGS
jgi:hypothetical protein